MRTSSAPSGERRTRTGSPFATKSRWFSLIALGSALLAAVVGMAGPANALQITKAPAKVSASAVLSVAGSPGAPQAGTPFY